MSYHQFPYQIPAYLRACRMASENIITLENFIDGKFFPTTNHLDSYDPSTGKVWAKVPDSGENEVNMAVAAAKKAFPSWSMTSKNERSELLLRIADIIDKRAEGLSIAESRDQGKPLWLAKAVDLPRCSLNFRQFAYAICNDNDMATTKPENGILNYTIHMPVGVAGLIVPWNFPLYLLTFKLAPALAYGNTVVAKPSELTSVTAWMLCSILQEADVPPGVVNIVFGYGHIVGEILTKHPDVPLISFTGSTKTGTHIQEVVAPQAKKLSLEMGGKNAAIVFEDADLEKCLPGLIRSSFINSGQVCLSTSRIFVQRNIFETFAQRFTNLAKEVKVNAPSADDVWMGPINNKMQWEKIKGYLKTAAEDGAIFLCGKDQYNIQLPAENQQGYFLKPVVLTGLSPKSICMQEEIFGPVTCLVPFDTEEEAIQMTNDVKYGLSNSVWSKDVGRVHRISYKLEAGTIWCNCWMVRDLQMPFGGMKMSGVGREGTKDSKEFFTEKKTVCIKYD